METVKCPVEGCTFKHEHPSYQPIIKHLCQHMNDQHQFGELCSALLQLGCTKMHLLDWKEDAVDVLSIYTLKHHIKNQVSTIKHQLDALMEIKNHTNFSLSINQSKSVDSILQSIKTQDQEQRPWQLLPYQGLRCMEEEEGRTTISAIIKCPLDDCSVETLFDDECYGSVQLRLRLHMAQHQLREIKEALGKIVAQNPKLERVDNLLRIDKIRHQLEIYFATKTINIAATVAELQRREIDQQFIRIRHKRIEHWATVRGIADSSLHLANVWGLHDFQKAGFKREDLLPVGSTTMYIPCGDERFGSEVNIVGSFDAFMSSRKTDNQLFCSEGVVYVSGDVTGFHQTSVPILFKFGENFVKKNICETKYLKCQPNWATGGSGRCLWCCEDDCFCGKDCCCRTDVPTPPSVLPFEAIEANVEKMRDWLLRQFATSTFNTCTQLTTLQHKQLNKSRPHQVITFHIDPNAEPRVCHKKPLRIPIHGEMEVIEELEHSEKLGIIEKLPRGTAPDTWCHRMMYTRMNGAIRTLIDFSPLDKCCIRDLLPAKSPFTVVKRIPPNTYKTVTEVWNNGNLLLPLAPHDQHLTNFITPFGRYRYKRAPRGFLTSDEAYNRCFNNATYLPNSERWCDDNVHYHSDLEQHWWQVIKFLGKVGSAGFVLNPGKFHFSQKSVRFAGFKISPQADKIEPISTSLDAIRCFPVPQLMTDWQDWVEITNQFGNLTEPGWTLKFYTREFRQLFLQIQHQVLETVCNDVKRFNLKRKTILQADWSSKGVGYSLAQKHCSCPGVAPKCCQNGWIITHVGFRVLDKHEKCYNSLEGEMLAITWGLQQCKDFTLGCRELLVLTNLQVLADVFPDIFLTLNESHMSRIGKMKQQTSRWRFTVIYNPLKLTRGLVNVAHLDHITRELEKTTGITFKQLVAELTPYDALLSAIRTCTEKGADVSLFIDDDESMSLKDGVLLSGERVIVPEMLQPFILQNMLQTHQGPTTWQFRNKNVNVIWDDMEQAINNHGILNNSVPRSSRQSKPYDLMFANFFYLPSRGIVGGVSYLIIGHCLDGLFQIVTAPGTETSTWLVAYLKRFFAMYGAPYQLSTDGGPVFTSAAVSKCLENFNVRHQVSEFHQSIIRLRGGLPQFGYLDCS